MHVQRSLKKALKNPVIVTGLDLRQEKPVILFPEIEQFTNLEFIDFSNCTSLDWADACNKLAKLPKLIYIKAFHVSIQHLPEEFGLLKTLKTIEFSSNETLTTLPESFSELTALEDIFIYMCGLENMPQTPWNFPNLQRLTLGKNKLKSFPQYFFDGMPALTELNVSDNQLESLPESVCKLKNLQNLTAGNNPLTSLPENLGELTQLNTLWLDNCPGLNYEKELQKIKHLPIKNLTLLDNNISELPSAFKDFTSLEFLNINSNPLPDVQGLIKTLSHLPLKELDVRLNGCEKVKMEEAKSIIPTLQQISFDSRTEEQLSGDIYSYITGSFGVPKNQQIELTITRDIIEYLQMVGGELKEITYIGDMPDPRPNILRVKSMYIDEEKYATFAIKNIVTSSGTLYKGDDPIDETQSGTISYATIYIGNVIEQDLFDFPQHKKEVTK